MNFDGTEGTEIGLDEAAGLTSRFRKENPGGTQGYFFGREKIMKILNQEKVVGIRVYFGLDDKLNQKLVMVGADANQNDLEMGVLMDMGIACPPQCGFQNKLNADL